MAPIDAFLALANAATGPISLASVIERALKAKDVWQFGELLDVPAVRGLATTEQAEWLRLLEIFAFGTYGDYKDARGVGTVRTALSEPLLKKLKQLTLVTIAASRKFLPYDTLMAELDVADAGAVEDIIISTIYAGLLTGKLDQREAFFEVHSTVGRDVRLDAASVAALAARVAAWQTAVDAALAAVDKPLAAVVREAEASARADAAMKRAMDDGKAAVEKESKDTRRDDAGGVGVVGAMASLGAMLGVMGGYGDDGSGRRRGPGGGRGARAAEPAVGGERAGGTRGAGVGGGGTAIASVRGGLCL